MARLFLSSRRAVFSILPGLCLLFPVGETVFNPTTAQAQTFIENILKRDSQKAQTRKKQPASRKKSASSQPKRKKSKAAAKPTQSPVAAPPSPVPVPVPIPEQRPEALKPTQPPQDKVEEKPIKPDEKPAPVEINPPAKETDNQQTKENDKVDQRPDEKEASRPAKDARVYQVACPVLISGAVEGKLLPPIKDGGQCGEHSPLSLTAIGKDEPLKFANPITTNCSMAVTLAQWSTEVKNAAREIYGQNIKISEIGTGSDYQCRRVNNGSAGRVSEHAFANALDIMSFKFSDGTKTELTSGWQGSDKEKAFWRAVHDASCKMFMTVIGPDGDAAHKTNMHLDQGCHGKSCLTRLCQ